jgi:hypothetical protein
VVLRPHIVWWESEHESHPTAVDVRHGSCRRDAVLCSVRVRLFSEFRVSILRRSSVPAADVPLVRLSGSTWPHNEPPAIPAQAASRVTFGRCRMPPLTSSKLSSSGSSESWLRSCRARHDLTQPLSSLGLRDGRSWRRAGRCWGPGDEQAVAHNPRSVQLDVRLNASHSMNAENRVGAHLQIVDEHIRRENEHDLAGIMRTFGQPRALTTSPSKRTT